MMQYSLNLEGSTSS